MTEGLSWVVALIAGMVGAFVGVVLAVAFLSLVEWLTGAVHRRKTRRKKLHW